LRESGSLWASGKRDGENRGFSGAKLHLVSASRVGSRRLGVELSEKRVPGEPVFESPSGTGPLRPRNGPKPTKTPAGAIHREYKHYFTVVKAGSTVDFPAAGRRGRARKAAEARGRSGARAGSAERESRREKSPVGGNGTEKSPVGGDRASFF
jgi:hypothetical protein